MASTTLEGELVRELTAVAAEAGCELLHAEYRGRTLRVFLDRPDGGVTIDDCANVSKEISALLDVADFGPDPAGSGGYTLEVSSPGLDRPLVGPRDYERFRGHAVRVTHRDPETKTQRTITGRLEGYRAAEGELVVVEAQGGKTHTLALDDVIRARLEIEL